MRLKAAKAAFPHTVPVLTGYLFLGMAYGILMDSAGYPWWLAVLMSLVVYAGSMQYAAVPLLAGGDPVGAFFLALMINARHLFYGLSMLERYRTAGKRLPYLVFAMSDETFSVNVSAPVPADVEPPVFWTWVSALDQCYWVAATAMGAVLGGALRVNTQGIEFVMTALFASIVTGQWLQNREHRPALAGFAASAACLWLFGPANFILPAMALIVGLLLLLRGAIERREQEKEAAAC